MKTLKEKIEVWRNKPITLNEIFNSTIVGIALIGAVVMGIGDYQYRKSVSECRAYIQTHNLEIESSKIKSYCEQNQRGYFIKESEKVNYSDNTKTPLFEVEPIPPTAGMREHHYADGITKEKLIETLKKELEEDQNNRIRSIGEEKGIVLKILEESQ